jgi:hypothetical protein
LELKAENNKLTVFKIELKNYDKYAIVGVKEGEVSVKERDGFAYTMLESAKKIKIMEKQGSIIKSNIEDLNVIMEAWD